MSRNFRLEAEMKEAATAAGCLESALPISKWMCRPITSRTPPKFRSGLRSAALKSRTASQCRTITTPSFVRRLSSTRT